MSKTVGSFIDLTLGLWTERCNILHEVDVAEFKQQKKEKMVERVRLRYEAMETVTPAAQYLFKNDVAEMCKNSTQYLGKWLETLELTEVNRVERGDTPGVTMDDIDSTVKKYCF